MIRKEHPLLKSVNSVIIDLPAPININYLWNMGSLLGMVLVIQLLSGIFLAMHYIPFTELAFKSVSDLRDVGGGFFLRSIHANGASFFFIFIYLHMGRGLYYGSYVMKETWNLGVIMLIVLMASAFIGYVLVWGQMSFWGATVITNLLSAIPYIGGSIVEWVWGGFSVNNATLNRFFVFHFLLPFLLVVLTVFHVVFLHTSGSSNPTLMSSVYKVPFHKYFAIKDLLGFFFFFCLFFVVVILFPYELGDPENFIKSNPMVTPIHIKPEWYFLWAYAILRSIPNKLGGVVAMFSAILVFFFMRGSLVKGNSMKVYSQVIYWMFVSNVVLLTWIGGQAVEDPFIILGQIFTLLYFIFIFLM